MTVRDSSCYDVSAIDVFLIYCCVSIYGDISINTLTQVNYIIPHFSGSLSLRVEKNVEISHK